MSEETKAQIIAVYRQAYELSTTYVPEQVLSFSDSDKEELQEAYAYAVNYTNKYLAAQKDLHFIITTLTVNKADIDATTPRGQVDTRAIDKMIAEVSSLLVTYKDILDSQKHIINYYEKTNLIF